MMIKFNGRALDLTPSTFNFQSAALYFLLRPDLTSDEPAKLFPRNAGPPLFFRTEANRVLHLGFEKHTAQWGEHQDAAALVEAENVAHKGDDTTGVKERILTGGRATAERRPVPEWARTKPTSARASRTSSDAGLDDEPVGDRVRRPPKDLRADSGNLERYYAVFGRRGAESQKERHGT